MIHHCKALVCTEGCYERVAHQMQETNQNFSKCTFFLFKIKFSAYLVTSKRRVCIWALQNGKLLLHQPMQLSAWDSASTKLLASMGSFLIYTSLPIMSEAQILHSFSSWKLFEFSKVISSCFYNIQRMPKYTRFGKGCKYERGAENTNDLLWQ